MEATGGVIAPSQPRTFSTKRIATIVAILALVALVVLSWYNNVSSVVPTNNLSGSSVASSIYSKKDLQQTTNKTKSSRSSTSHNKEEAVAPNGVVFYDLNAPLAETYVMDSIGPAVLNSSSYTYNPLQNCSVTTRFRLIIPSSSTSNKNKKNTQQPWILQTFDARGVAKTVGGDELYVIWKAQNRDQTPAWAHDRHDGTYELEFVQPPIRNQPSIEQSAAKGNLIVFYDYSCGIGALAAPSKDNFTRNGEVQVVMQQKVGVRPPMRQFQEPNRDYSMDLSTYDFVYFFGDSMIQQLCARYRRGKGMISYWNEKMFYQENVGQSLTTVEEVDTMLQKLRDWHGSNLTDGGTSIAVVTGSSLWDLLRGHTDPGLHLHIAACRSFVTHFRTEYPGVDLYWKSPSALHFHKLPNLRADPNASLKERAKYMSQALPYHMYLLQKALMEELDVPFLDLYEAYYLSGPWSRTPKDGRHFKDEISALLLSYYWRGLNVTGAYERLSV
jgi:hypothetical protein